MQMLISRAQPTLKLPCISAQSSVTCNGEYRRPVIKAQPSFHDVDAENGERKLYVMYQMVPCFRRLSVQTRTPFAVDPLEKMA